MRLDGPLPLAIARLCVPVCTISGWCSEDSDAWDDAFIGAVVGAVVGAVIDVVANVVPGVDLGVVAGIVTGGSDGACFIGRIKVRISWAICDKDSLDCSA